jgi:hypothetical protein
MLFSVLMLCCCSGTAISADTVSASQGFASENEFMAHMKGETACVSQQCHAQFLKERKFSHEPANTGACDACHSAKE